MKNKYILLFLFGFFGIHASAQTLAQAKILYEKGQYEQIGRASSRERV